MAISEKRILASADGELVEEGDPKGQVLVVAKGGEITPEIEQRIKDLKSKKKTMTEATGHQIVNKGDDAPKPETGSHVTEVAGEGSKSLSLLDDEPANDADKDKAKAPKPSGKGLTVDKTALPGTQS